MKNKSKLLLLPASFLLLTGCGSSANVSIPKNYAAIDKADPTAREAFFNKVGEDVALTYEKAVQGFMAEGSFSFKELSYEEVRSSGKTNYIKIADFEADYSFGLVGLNEGAAKAKAVLKIEDAGFKLEYKKSDKVYSLSASDLDAAAYYVDNTLYYDLTDKNVKTFVNDAIDFSYNINDRADRTDEIKKDKDFMAKYLGKYYVKDDEVEEVANDIPTSLTQKDVSNIQKLLGSAFDEILKEEKAKDLLTLAEDKNSKGAAISFALTSEPVEVEDAQVSGDLAASLVFDKEGIFSRFGFKGNLKVAGDDFKFALDKLDFGANFKYGANSVKLPSFKDYKEIQKD